MYGRFNLIEKTLFQFIKLATEYGIKFFETSAQEDIVSINVGYISYVMSILECRGSIPYSCQRY
jgi:hypothetical protein